jgi:hypothetical protein
MNYNQLLKFNNSLYQTISMLKTISNVNIGIDPI